jgi:hypothetical protein
MEVAQWEAPVHVLTEEDAESILAPALSILPMTDPAWPP